MGGVGILPAGGGDGGADDRGDEPGAGVPPGDAGFVLAPPRVFTGTADDRPKRAMKIRNPFMLFEPANVKEQC